MNISRSERLAAELRNHERRVATKITVRIVNPMPGGKQRLKWDCAERHVQSGAAEWVRLRGELCVEFGGHKHDSALRNIRKSLAESRAIHSTMATLKQVAGLPMVNPLQVLAPSPRKDWAWRNAVMRNSAAEVNQK